MLLAKGNLKLVATSLMAMWPLGSHVKKGDREGRHGPHLNLQTVMTTCVITIWTIAQLVAIHHCHSSVGLVRWLTTGLLGWSGGSPSVVVVVQWWLGVVEGSSTVDVRVVVGSSHVNGATLAQT